MKFLLSQKEIDDDLQRANKLIKQGKIIDKEVPEYYCKGISPFSKKTTIIFAIFFGFFAIDRFYLKKWISAFSKLFLHIIATPLISLIWIPLPLNETVDVFKYVSIEYIIFAIVIYLFSFSYYIGDIFLAIWKLRDSKFRCVKNKKYERFTYQN